MKVNHITEENLNAFIDNQLATDERLQVFNALKEDQVLSQLLCELQRNDEFLSLAYSNTPKPAYNPFLAATQSNNRIRQMLAASVIFAVSLLTGWQLHQYYNPESTVSIQDISQLTADKLQNNKVLLHISAMNTSRIDNALNKTEALLKQKDNNLQIEIVANADGLGMLRKNSPYASRIKTLASNHKNLSFKACGIAMQAAKLKEGKDVELLPEAQKVPAALEEILGRLKAGWLYYKS